MSLTPEEHDYIGQVIAEDAAERAPRNRRVSAEPAPVPPAGDVEVRDAFCAAYRELRGYAPLRVEGTNEYKIFTAGFDSRSAHVTRLTAERDGLTKKIEALRSILRMARVSRDDALLDKSELQSELTKALELFSDLVSSPDAVMVPLHLWKRVQAFAHQSAPAAKGSPKVRESLLKENQRVTPARFKCLACGEYHEGMSGLPCPKMTPYSQVNP